MAKNLVIVESPAKAKTIEGYLGKDFTVRSSFGHVRDLADKELSIDVENSFEPKYVISSDKKKVITELKKLAKDAEMIWLATDEDREGEAISWHLMEALALKPEKTKRITFNEITKTAIKRAIDNPREIDINLVNAQQARRVLDRLVGFELSPVLWRKIKPALSAGRVQSVAVRLVVEREREITDFQPKSSFRLRADLDVKGTPLVAELSNKTETEEEARKVLTDAAGKDFNIAKIEDKPGKKSPAPPFTTSTLQQEASSKLGFSVTRTMVVAQKLYEAGRITYMRTDSVNLSDDARKGAKDAILNSWGDDYSKERNFKSKNSSAQEAHEAIRPSDFSLENIDADRDEQRLYHLIWRRAIASQMSEAKVLRTAVHIEVPGTDQEWKATGEVLQFDGFLKVYGADDDEGKKMLPPLTEGQTLPYTKVYANQRFTKPPARYNEATLVRKLEELGIGRPSTYAPTIGTIQKRNYVVKEDREGLKREALYMELAGTNVKEEVQEETYGSEKAKLFPTDIGMVVNDFLVQNFEQILDYGFTAEVEGKFDQIAHGSVNWADMIDSFYHPFHHNIEDTLQNSEAAKGDRILGDDPISGKPVIARIGRFGPMIQIGDKDDEEKPRFASLRKDQSIQTINLEEALELFKLPRVLGEYEGEEVKANIGRYGPYVQIKREFVSIPEGEDPMSIELSRAIELIIEKRKEAANALIHEFTDHDIKVLKGRYGPYIKQGKKNYKIPKEEDPEGLTAERCLEIIETQPAKGRRRKAK